jgi:hypothetical protein
MPNEVTPWLTALRAYSSEMMSSGQTRFQRPGRTYLDEFAAVMVSSMVPLELCQHWSTYLGEKVVREKEYRSAILALGRFELAGRSEG